MSKAHPGFKAVEAKVAQEPGIRNPGAVVAAAARKASPQAKAANPRLDRVAMTDGGRVIPDTGETPRRRLLANDDPASKDRSRTPNAFRGKLQPSFEEGNSLPETLNPNRTIKLANGGPPHRQAIGAAASGAGGGGTSAGGGSAGTSAANGGKVGAFSTYTPQPQQD